MRELFVLRCSFVPRGTDASYDYERRNAGLGSATIAARLTIWTPKIALATALSVFWLGPATAENHSAEYKTGHLLSWQKNGVGETCRTDSGVLGPKTECTQNQVKIYRVRLEGNIYALRADTPIDTDDPLAALQPDQEFKYRLDVKGHVWIPAPINKGRYHKPDHEAKYIVEQIDKAPAS